jgi:hypothetical protein
LSYLFAPEILLNENNNRPIINPPKPKSEPAASKTSEALHEGVKRLSLLQKIAPLVMQRYPDIKAIDHECKSIFAHYTMMLRQLLSSFTDDRYKRSLPEWALIVKYANDHGVRQAARKYSGETPDGTKIPLSTKSIRERMNDPKRQEFFDTYSHYETKFLMFTSTVIGAVVQDPELLATYEEYEREYDDNDKNRLVEREKEEQGSKTGQIQMDRPEQNDYAELLQGNYNDAIYNDGLYYDYFYVRHYDPELRKNKS